MVELSYRGKRAISGFKKEEKNLRHSWQKVKMLLDSYFTVKCLKTLTLHVKRVFAP